MSTLTMNKPHTDARIWDRFAKRYARKAVPDQAAYEDQAREDRQLSEAPRSRAGDRLRHGYDSAAPRAQGRVYSGDGLLSEDD